MELFNKSNNTSPFNNGNMIPNADVGQPRNEARLNLDLAMAQNPFDQFNATAEHQDSKSAAPKSPIPEYISFTSNDMDKDNSEHPQSISSKPEGEAVNSPADDSTVGSEDFASVTPDVASAPVQELKQQVQQPLLAKPNQHYQQQQQQQQPHNASPFDSIGVNQQVQKFDHSGADMSQFFAQGSKQAATVASYQPNVAHGNNREANQQGYPDAIQVQEQTSTKQESSPTSGNGNFRRNLEQQHQNPLGPGPFNTVSINNFQAHAQSREVSVSPPQQYNTPGGSFHNTGFGQVTFGSNQNLHYQGSTEKHAQPLSPAAKSNGQSAHHPTSPASVTQYGAFAETKVGDKAPTTNIANSSGQREDGGYDYFSGPPMGTSVLQNTRSGAMNTSDGQYNHILNGMNSMAIYPQVQPGQEQYQRPPQSQHSPIAVGQGNMDQQWQNVYHNPSNSSSWQQVNQTQVTQGQSANQCQISWNSVQQQQASNLPNRGVPQYNYHDSPVQQQQQQLVKQDTAKWNSMQQQPYNNMYHAPNGSDHGPSSNILPDLNHRSPNGEIQSHQPWSYETNSHAYNYYDQQSRAISSPYDSDDCDPTDSHKRSKDIVREYGARRNALRLLDEATGMTARQATQQTYGDQQEANRPIQRRLGLLAESSRKIKNPRTWCDPELEEDKCQLDRDRATIAQRRALKMMGKFHN